MSTLSKEQQKNLIDRLDQINRFICLRCDGYLVSAALSRVAKNKLAIVFYVNGSFKGKWVGAAEDVENYPEAVRFCRPSVRNKYTTKTIKRHEKLFGKRNTKKDGLYDKVKIYYPCWNRPAPFLKHLMKNNESIEVLSDLEFKEHIAALKESEVCDEQTN